MVKPLNCTKVQKFRHQVFYFPCPLEGGGGGGRKGVGEGTSKRHFQHYLNHIALGSAPIHAFLEFPRPVFRAIFFPGHCLLFHSRDKDLESAIKVAMGKMNSTPNN